MADVKLYDANGAQTGVADAEYEPDRAGIVEVAGRLYIWNQRNNQWREAVETLVVKSAAPAAAKAKDDD